MIFFLPNVFFSVCCNCVVFHNQDLPKPYPQKYKGHLIPTPICTGIQGLAISIHSIFLNKYSFSISNYTFRTLPFPAMISLLVKPKSRFLKFSIKLESSFLDFSINSSSPEKNLPLLSRPRSSQFFFFAIHQISFATFITSVVR